MAIIRGRQTQNTILGKKVVIRDVTDFLNTEYRRYSNYVISTRAIPSIWDSFKVGARKILYSAFTGGLRDGSEKKLLNLVGDVFNKTLYAHGDSSLVGTIMTMAAPFTDNLNTIDIIGQGGALRSPKSFASPRYLFCKLSKYAKLYKVDEDLLEYVFDEGEFLEPTHFLPIIPTVLTSRAEGMAPGYKFQVFSYNPIDIIDACIEILEKGVQTTVIRPYVRGIDQSRFMQDPETGRWWNIGEYTVDTKSDIFRITDLPYDVTFEKIEKKLNSYIEKNYIKDWKNFSHDDVIDYRIQFNKSQLSREVMPDRKERLLKNFFIQTQLPDDLLYLLDDKGKVKHFKDKNEVIKYFVTIRLNKYNERKDKLVKVMESRLQDNSSLIKFIELVISGKIKIQNRKKADIRVDMQKHDLPDSLLSNSISKLTADEIEELKRKNEEIKAELKYIKETSIEQMYINDLNQLRKDIAEDFDADPIQREPVKKTEKKREDEDKPKRKATPLLDNGSLF